MVFFLRKHQFFTGGSMKTKDNQTRALLPVTLGTGRIPFARGMSAGNWVFASGVLATDFQSGLAPDVLQAGRPLSGSPKWYREAACMFTPGPGGPESRRRRFCVRCENRSVLSGLAGRSVLSSGPAPVLRRLYRAEHFHSRARPAPAGSLHAYGGDGGPGGPEAADHPDFSEEPRSALDIVLRTGGDLRGFRFRGRIPGSLADR